MTRASAADGDTVPASSASGGRVVLAEMRNRLARTRPGFAYAKWSHYRRYEVNRALAPDQDVLDELLQEGVVVIPDYATRSEVERIRSQLEGEVASLREGTCNGEQRGHRFPEYGVYRLLEADSIAPATKGFFDDPFIHGLAKAYVGPQVDSFQRMVELRDGPGRISTADITHFDDWKQRFKAFLYLVDVSEREAPFVYFKRSHHPGPWRRKREWEYVRDGKAGTYGSFLPSEVDRLKREHHFEERVCTGAAGTLILTDTRGLHRGTPLAGERRLLLGNFFDVRY